MNELKELSKMASKRSLVVSIIGRPNVGKSTLFNRLMNAANKSITYDQPGVTRDRHYGIATLDSIPRIEPVEMILIDTGGFLPEVDNNLSHNAHDEKMKTFFNIMVDQAYEAIEESDLVLLVMDGRQGLVPFDQLIADKIRERKKDFWAVVNKIDSDKQEGHELEFYGLGIDSEQLFAVSASHGKGVGHLKERIQEYVAAHDAELMQKSKLQKGVTPREKVVSRLAIIGAPNAGKSTLLNRLLKADRALVSDIAGTTVDPIEGFFDLYFGPEVNELDSAIESSRVNNRQLLTQYENLRSSNPELFSEGMMEYFDEEDAAAAGAQSLENDPFALDEESLAMSVEAEFEEKSIEEMERELSLTDEPEELHEREGEEDAVVEEDTNFWRSIHLIDTAGIRKAKKITDFVEAQSVYRALRCITESDIVLFMIDATKGISHQDRRLLDIALEKGKSVIVCLNKMDLMERKFKTSKERREWLADLQAYVPWLSFCELIPISAKSGSGLGRLKDSIKKTVLTRHKRFPTGELNRVLFGLFQNNPIYLTGAKSSSFKLKYASMVKSGPPTVMLFVNKSLGIPENYRRFLVNGVRKHFEIRNSPIHLIFRSGSSLERKGASTTT